MIYFFHYTGMKTPVHTILFVGILKYLFYIFFIINFCFKMYLTCFMFLCLLTLSSVIGISSIFFPAFLIFLLFVILPIFIIFIVIKSSLIFLVASFMRVGRCQPVWSRVCRVLACCSVCISLGVDCSVTTWAL